MALKTSAPAVSATLYGILFVTVFCSVFYLGTLIRHVLWDYGVGLDLKTASVLGYLIVAFAAVISISSVVFIAVN